ncbi:MAG: methyltransferase domain-containing protein [Steroidobacteraceae bacterium]
MTQDTGTYYDRLSRWTALARFLGYGGGRGTLTVHRALADPSSGGKPTPTRLHDLLVESLPPLAAPRVLDAGCGLGGTLLHLASRLGGTLTGLTLSEQQARIGRAAAARAGLQDRIDIHVRSYDAPPEQHFDLIVAIESLAHSPDPATSVQALASRLAPGGIMAIVDDKPEAAAQGTRDLELFKSGWRLPVLWGSDHYHRALREQGLTPIANHDLTPHVRPRSLAQIRRLELLNRFAHRVVPSEGFRAMLDSYHGGLALERLYRRALMRYRLLIAQKL